MVEALTDEQQQYMAAYRPLARPMARALMAPHIFEGGRMVYLPFDEEHPEQWEHSAQDPDCFLLENEPSPIEETNKLARLADHRFDDMVEMAGANSEAQEIIDAVGQLVADGKNIWIMTAHVDDLTDIAYAGHITANQLAAQNQPDHNPKNTLIMVSKGIAEAGYLMDFEDALEPVPIPMVGVMQTGFTRVVQTWPKTPSTDEQLAKLPDFAVSWINSNAIASVEKTYSEGGTIGAIAPTGRTRLVNGAMSPINNKTLRMMALPDTYALGMMVWRQSDTPVAKFSGMPVPIDPERPEQIDELIIRLTKEMNEQIPGENFLYLPPEHRKLGETALGSS